MYVCMYLIIVKSSKDRHGVRNTGADNAVRRYVVHHFNIRSQGSRLPIRTLPQLAPAQRREGIVRICKIYDFMTITLRSQQ